MGVVMCRFQDEKGDSAKKQLKNCMSPPTRLKASRYNHFIQYNGTMYGYNLLFRTIISIPAEVYPQISAFLNSLRRESTLLDKEGSQLPIPEQWVTALKDSRFLIDEALDELDFIKFRYYRHLYANDSLSLIILTTLWCNLNCPYCFESKRRAFMKQDVEKAIMKWVQDKFRGKRKVRIAWFGGEPLLGRQSIFRLTPKLQTFCKDIGANYSASLTTNGVFFDGAFQQSIPDLGIDSVSITLDGDRNDHNELRKSRNGAGSFDQIYGNIVSFCEHAYPCRLTLRVNCCDENYDRIEGLLDRFPIFVRERVPVFFRWIWANEASGNRVFSSALCGPGAFHGLSKLYESAHALGWHTSNPTGAKTDSYCEVDSLDHFGIDPEGNVYLCSHSFNASESIGSLLSEKDGSQPGSLGVYTRWYTINPFDDEECITCSVLPMCLGGCRKQRMKGKRHCIEEKCSLDRFIANTIENRLLSQQTNEERR